MPTPTTDKTDTYAEYVERPRLQLQLSVMEAALGMCIEVTSATAHLVYHINKALNDRLSYPVAHLRDLKEQAGKYVKVPLGGYRNGAMHKGRVEYYGDLLPLAEGVKSSKESGGVYFILHADGDSKLVVEVIDPVI